MKARTSRLAPLVGLLALAAGLSACRPAKTPVVVAPVVLDPPTSKADAWKQVAEDADEDRIATLATVWTQALEEARKSNARAVRAENVLLQPDAALPRPAPTPGSYYCRLVKLGRTRARGPALETFKPFYCYVDVEGDLLTIVKQTGDTRPAGRLWEDNELNRLIFLGSLARASEKPRAYGEDPKRDMAGVLERIAPFRWRLVVPTPQGTSKLEVYELRPTEKQRE